MHTPFCAKQHHFLASAPVYITTFGVTLLDAANHGAVFAQTEPRQDTLMHEGYSELVLDNCHFESNTAQGSGGAAVTAFAVNSFFNQSTFLSNVGSQDGGSISIYPDPDLDYSGPSSTVVAGSTFRSNQGQ